MNHTRPWNSSTLIIPGLLGLFLLLSSGFDLIPELGVFNAKRLLENFVLLAVSAVALGSGTLRRSLSVQLARIPRWMGVALGAALVLGFVSALRFPHPEYGLVDVAMLAVLVISMLIVAACRDAAGSRFDRLAMVMVAALGIIVALAEFMGLLAGWALGVEFSFDQMLVRFAHPRFYNQLQTWSLPLLAALPFVLGGGRHLRLAAVMLLGLQWCLLLMSGGRGSFLSLVIALLFIALLVPSGRPAWLRLHAGGLLLGFALYAAVLAGHAVLAKGGGDFVELSVGRPMLHSTGRTQLWSLAWKDALAEPLLGAGPARYNCGESLVLASHPHNFPMRILAEWGFPAAILILAVIVFVAWALIRRLLRDRRVPGENQALKLMLAACVLAGGLHACLSGLLTMPASQVMAVLVCGWLLGILENDRQDGPRRSTRGFVACLAGFALCAAITVFSVLEIRQIEFRTQALREQEAGTPRYWQHGRSCLYSHD